jgi:hypothetical protein
MPDHNFSRPYDAQHAQGAGETIAPAAGRPTQPATRSLSPRRTPDTRRVDAFDRWVEATRALPALPPLDPPAELPAPGHQSPWPDDHWALRAPVQPPAFPRVDLPHPLPASLTPPAARALSTRAYADPYPGHSIRHLDPASPQWWSGLPNRTSPPTPALPPATPRATALDITARRIARAEQRIFALCALCALFLLAGAVAVLWWYPSGSTPIARHGSSALPASRASQEHATGQTSGSTQSAPLAPGTPAALPTPTHVAPAAPSVPSNAPVVPVVPTTASLSLACSDPGTPLPLYNAGAVVQSWRIALPPSVAGNGWIGTLTGAVNPGKTLTLHLWHIAGTPLTPVTLYVQSAGQQTAVHMTFAAC